MKPQPEKKPDKIRVLIADDEALARERIRSLMEKEDRIEVVGEASDGAETLNLVEELNPDLLFLDIQMPELTGIDVASRIQDSDTKIPSIIFVTAYDEFALKAFDLHAIDYLLKPYDRTRFNTALERAINSHQTREPGKIEQTLAALVSTFRPPASEYLDRLSIKTEGRIILLPISEVAHIAAANNYVEIHSNSESYLMRETLSQLESQLDPKKFLRISRSSIVAIDRIREIHPLFHGEHTLILSNGTKLTSTRSYKDALKPLLGK